MTMTAARTTASAVEPEAPPDHAECERHRERLRYRRRKIAREHELFRMTVRAALVKVWEDHAPNPDNRWCSDYDEAVLYPLGLEGIDRDDY